MTRSRDSPPTREHLGMPFFVGMLGILALVVTLVFWKDPPYDSSDRRCCLWIAYVLLAMLTVEFLARLRIDMWPVRLVHALLVPMLVLLLLLLLRVRTPPIWWFAQIFRGPFFLVLFWVLQWGLVLPCYHILVGKGGRRHPLSGGEIQIVLLVACLLVGVMPWLLYESNIVL